MNEHTSDYVVESKVPTVSDYLRLRKAGGLSNFSEDAATLGLVGTIFGISVIYRSEVVGMGRVVGDGGCFFQIVDIVVMPGHQGKGLGTRIMTELVDYLNTQLPSTAFVSLFADPPANKLYETFGFVETAPNSLGMSLRIG